MDISNAQTLGIAVLVSLTLLGGYLMVLQIKDLSREKPDPKLTYATKADYEQFTLLARRTHDELAALVHSNAQQTAALCAQMNLALHRINELAIKLDRLQERLLA